MNSAFICACVTIILGILVYFLYVKNIRSLKKNMLLALTTGVFSIAFLIYPLQIEYKNTFTRVMASFIYALKCAGLGQNLQVLSRINLNEIDGLLSFILVNILFIAMPIITGSFIMTFIENIITKIGFTLLKNKELHIFSEVNSKSLLIAKKLQENKKARVVFTDVADVTDKSKINVKSVNMSGKITDIKFEKNKKMLNFYMISENEEENLHKTLELINKYKNRENIKINIVNNSEEASVILDSTDKGKISVEIINEKERAIFNLLDKTPLYLNSVDKTISILIVGCGKLGKEFLKNATWCSMMVGYKLEILVIDVNAEKVRDNIYVEAPEILDYYDIKFITADIKSDEAIMALKKRPKVNYILVSMDNDNKNLEASIMLRRFYLREFKREPIINLWILNEYKQEQILHIVNEKNNSYKLNAFGSFEDLYFRNNIVNSDIERIAEQIHLTYCPEDINFERYNLLEYNKRSSRASGLHIKYKIYSILQDRYTDDMKENLRLFRELYNDEIEEKLTRNEHDRWNAYTRSIGYIHASIDEVKNYYDKTNYYVHYLARMHPALVTFEELDNLSVELSKITGRNIDMVGYDRDIIKFIRDRVEF